MTTNKELLSCSFCGKTEEEVYKLIAGPSVFICDECTDACTEIVQESDPEYKSNIQKWLMNQGVSEHFGIDEDDCLAFLERYRKMTSQQQQAIRTILFVDD